MISLSNLTPQTCNLQPSRIRYRKRFCLEEARKKERRLSRFDDIIDLPYSMLLSLLVDSPVGNDAVALTTSPIAAAAGPFVPEGMTVRRDEEGSRSWEGG